MTSYVVDPADRVAGEITVPGDKSISHRAVMFGALAKGATHVTGFLEGEDCLSTMQAVAHLGVRVERPGPGEVIVDGVGLRGLRAPDGHARHGQRGHRDAALHGAAQRAAVRFRTDRRRIADAPADGARREAAASHGRAHRNARRANRRCGFTAAQQLQGIRYEMPVASAQVKSAVLLAGLYADRRDHRGRTGRHARSHRAHAAELRLRGPRTRRRGDSRCAAVAAGGEHPRAGRHLVGGVLPGRGVPRRARAVHDPRRRRQPDAHRHPRNAGADGRGPAPGQSPQLRHGAGGRHRSAAVAAARARASPSGSCRSRSTSSRRCSSRRRARKARRWSPAPRNCASRKATASPPWRAASRCSACSTKCCRRHAHRGRRPFGGGTIDSRGDHRIAMAFAVASLRATAPIEILDVANVATVVPRLRRARQLGRTGDRGASA